MRSPIRRFANLTGQSASGRRPWNIARGSGSADGLAMKVKLPGAAASQCPLRTSARRSPYKPACDRPCDRRPRGHRGDLPHRRTAQRERLTPSVLRPWADSSALTRDNRTASATSVTPLTFIVYYRSFSDQVRVRARCRSVFSSILGSGGRACLRSSASCAASLRNDYFAD